MTVVVVVSGYFCGCKWCFYYVTIYYCIGRAVNAGSFGQSKNFQFFMNNSECSEFVLLFYQFHYFTNLSFYSPIHSFICSCIHPFVCLPIHSCVHSIPVSVGSNTSQFDPTELLTGEQACATDAARTSCGLSAIFCGDCRE